ncbi:glycosyltransferase family 2 protein [Dactylosporangium vinaceum]|uniref:Glycosyltransferase n=1 Tax=Dactylosporangium vinaceum TaxID=53362 RepID=A0ABV5MMB9_9ACTN|nr:glycosyltransferase [Dactylosporangium vinaceum]UAB93289.1 glycosyltransferase family 2 protein [Dactylosporangium vinaceum]
MNLVAVLIVRDEAADIPGCLASLGGIVDGIHVHDTGSTDATADLARSMGAVVSTGEWPGDFAAARNAALAAAGRTDWVLSVDADERATADPGRLRALLASARTDALLVQIDNRHDELPYTQYTPRIFRPSAVHWAGRVHERLVPERGTWPALPGEALRLTHHGYEHRAVRTGKARRNAALAEAQLPATTGEDRATTLLDLGRSYVGAGRPQDAVDTFEALRAEAVPGTRQWILGTDALARLLLGAGHDDAVVVLARQLRGHGVDRQYCDWLESQALAQLGHTADAWQLLRHVRRVVDPAGRVYPPEHLAELKRLLGALAGSHR